MEPDEFNLGSASISSYLIIDPSSSRKSIRQLLSQLGAKPHQIEVAEGIGDALELMVKKKSQVIFADHGLVKDRLSELVELQRQSIAPGSPKALFLLTSNGSQAQASEVAEGEVDAMIMRPFTFGDLQERVIAVLNEVFFPKPTQRLINQGTGLLKTGQLDPAFESFKRACELDPNSAVAYASMASIRMQQGNAKEAQALFEQGLKLNQTHYRCLLGMIDLLSDAKNHAGAYAYARELSAHHPVPMKRLPSFIRLSVLNRKFEDIFEFQKLTDEKDFIDSEVSTYLAAGLVVCALFLFKQNVSERAVETLKKAERMARGNSRILTRVVIALSDAGLENEFNAFLSRMPVEVQDSTEVKLSQLEKLKHQDPGSALKMAMQFIQQSVKSEAIFRIAIELSVRLNRNERAIHELIEGAIRQFPELEKEWRKFSPQAS